MRVKETKSVKLKKAICEHLDGRKKKEQAIIGLFFADENGKLVIGKYKGMHRSIVKNLKRLDKKQLDDIYNSVFELNTGIKKIDN